jgi:hypothetical protein
VTGERILAVGSKKLDKLFALFGRKARANADMMEDAGIVKQTE